MPINERNNLVTNPSFKTDTTGWAATGSSTIARITSDAFYGNSCLEVTKAAASSSGVAASARIAVTASASYALGVYVKIPALGETGTLRASVKWYTALSGGTLISTSNSLSLEVIGGDDWVRLTGVFTSPSNALGALIEITQPTAGTASEVFYVDAIQFEQADYVYEYVDDLTQAQENQKVADVFRPVPYPKITGLKLLGDISINSLILNTIDENNVLWVCNDIEGWWVHPEPEVRDLPRGYGDGSYDVRGRYQARQLTLTGTFLPPDPSYVSIARSKLIENTDLVYVGAWLRVNEDPTKVAWVRLSGRPDITTVNARGKTEFSIGLRAPDPLKYEWYDGHELGYRSVTIPAESASPAATGVDTVTNTGNAYAPVVFEITGPLVGPATITNVTTNESITIIESLRGSVSKTVSNKALTSNVATLTTSAAHSLSVGDEVTIAGVDSTFNGVYTVATVPTTTTFTYALTADNVSSASATGTVARAADILEIDTKEHEVALNGDAIGKRNLIDVLAEWVLLAPGGNEISFADDGAANSTASLTVYYRSAWLG